MSSLNALQHLAEQQCAVAIQTLEHPGWMVMIKPPRDLERKLRVEGDPPRPSNNNRGGASWLVCKIEGGTFTGLGDPARLEEILRCYSEWISEPRQSNSRRSD